MSDAPQTPEAVVAEAISDLSQETRRLVKSEMDAAQEEMWEKAKRSAPALGMAAVAGGMGLFAAASSYRLTLRALEKLFPPTVAALLATVGFAAGAALTGTKAFAQLRRLPPLLPTRTIEEAGRRVGAVAP